MKKPILIGCLILILGILIGGAISQESAQIDLDNIRPINRANIDNNLANLSEGENITIHFWEMGCSMRKSIRRKLEFIKTGNAYNVRFCEMQVNLELNEILLALNEFEEYISAIDQTGYCTTQRKFAVQIEGLNYIGFDPSCGGNAFYHLVMKLLNVKYFDKTFASCN